MIFLFLNAFADIPLNESAGMRAEALVESILENHPMIDFRKVPSPCYLLDESLLDANLAVIDRVRRESGAEIIVALKACAMWSIFPELARHSDGATASSAAEARLVLEEYGRPAHTYAPVYTDSNIEEILRCSDHITFNSVAQFERFGQQALIRGISCGLRVNPRYSPVETDLYNPCVAGSRLGIVPEELHELPAGIEGLHFHVLCESRPEHLRLALEALERNFGHLLPRIKWLNMGGGHLMTHADYDCDELIALLRDFRARHPHLRLILEPGCLKPFGNVTPIYRLFSSREAHGHGARAI